MGKAPLTEPEMYALLAKTCPTYANLRAGFPKKRGTDLTPAAKNHYELRKLQGHSACLCCPETGRLLRLLRGRLLTKNLIERK